MALICVFVGPKSGATAVFWNVASAPDQAVAVEPGAFEHAADVGDVGHRQHPRVRRAAMGKDVADGAEQRLPRGLRLVDGLEWEAVRARDQRAEIFQALCAPAQRREDLRGADPAVLV